jgi:hypothetical protein
MTNAIRPDPHHPRVEDAALAVSPAIAAGQHPAGFDARRRLLVRFALASLGGMPWLAACGGAEGGSAPTDVAAAVQPAPSVPSPAAVPSQPAVPSGPVPQFLTSDGGLGAVASVGNFSGPTRRYWHNRLQIEWKRKNFMGNWLDAGQVEEGRTPYGSTASVTAVGQTLSVTVTALVERWMASDLNRGFYLSARPTASAWPVQFHGRGDPTPANRPTLHVVTTTGAYELPAAANAIWTDSSDFGQVSKNSWGIAGGQCAILRFDLSGVAGSVTSAVLSFKCSGFGSPSHVGQVIDVFEADP